jgi:hypothetical protein
MMGFLSFFGRVLFASIFLLSAYQEYVRPSPLPSPSSHGVMAVPNFEAATGSGARGTGGTVRPAPDLAAFRVDWVSQGCSVLLPPVSLLVVGKEWYSRWGGSSG